MKPEKNKSKTTANKPGESRSNAVVIENEPSAGTNSIPVIFFILLALGLFGGMLYLDRYGGGFNRLVYSPYAKFEDIPQPVLGPEEQLARKGKLIYGNYCSACHMANGLGSPTAPPLAGSEWVTSAGHERLARIVNGGLTGPIKVKGQEYNLPGMLAWGQVISSDEDMAAVLTYIRSNKDWGHSAAAVSPEHVKAVREATKSRSEPWTAKELLELPDAAPTSAKP